MELCDGARKSAAHLFCEEADAVVQVHLEGFAEQRVERLPRALHAAVGAHCEAQDPGQPEQERGRTRWRLNKSERTSLHAEAMLSDNGEQVPDLHVLDGPSFRPTHAGLQNAVCQGSPVKLLSLLHDRTIEATA